MFQIEKNIVLPASKLEPEYPFAYMEPGDSFFVPRDHRKSDTLAATLSKAARDAFGKGNYATRRIKDEDGNFTGVRVWRKA